MLVNRSSVVVTTDYTLDLYNVGKVFVNTDNNITITIPTPSNDLDVYIKNLGSGTTTINKVNGSPIATRSNRKFDEDSGITINSLETYLITYVKELDTFLIL